MITILTPHNTTGMKIIQIVRCHDIAMWYNSRIGEIFYAYREYEDSFLVRTTDSGYSNIVLKTDCIILNEEG